MRANGLLSRLELPSEDDPRFDETVQVALNNMMFAV